jgi:very-short-patch-repair endonuclease
MTRVAVTSCMAQQKKKGFNKLERVGNELLDSMGVDYKTQVLMCGKFLVDVLIPDKKIVIQWDGDYWHGYGGGKSLRQKKRARLDKSQDAYLCKAGYTVLRFWEHEVYKEANKVSENIRTALQ